MSAKEVKFEKVLSSKEAADFLRALAQEIESGSKDQLKEFDLEFDDLKKLKIEIKRSGEQLHLKGKAKLNQADEVETPAEAAAGEGKAKAEKPLKYKTLKKRMEKSFKAISASLAKDALPAKDAVDSFVADSERMVSYPGFGDEYYEEYSKVCVQFNVAFENSDLTALKEKCAELAAVKKLCHDRYK